jgi:hypothetical protein
MGPKSRISGTLKKSQTPPIRPRMGPKSRISDTLQKSQTPPIRPKMGPKSRMGPTIKLNTDTVEEMEIDLDVSTYYF